MGEQVVLFKYTFHVGGSFSFMPFKYEGGRVEIYESFDYFTSWDQFVEFIRSFRFENVKKVYQQQTLGTINAHEDLKHIHDAETALVGFSLCNERNGCVFFLEHGDEHSIFNPKVGETNVKLLGTRLISNDETRMENDETEKVDDGNKTEEDEDFVPSTDEESNEDMETEDSSNENQESVDGYETEYLDSDDGGEIDSEVDEGGEGSLPNIRFRRSKYPKFDLKQIPPVFEIGLMFDDIEQLKEACVEYSVFHHRNLWFKKSDRKRLQVKCRDGCPFHIWASYDESLDQFQIKRLRSKHKCNKSWKLKLVSARYIAFKFQKTIMETHRLKLKDLKEKVKSDLKVNINVHMCKKAKKIVKSELDGNIPQEYGMLRDYALELLTKNPQSTIVIDGEPSPDLTYCTFRRMYFCFDACRRGFLEGCRRIFGVDGCFLKGEVKGEILTAVGRDANDQMFPIAWAVVEVENKDSWLWFLSLLKEDLGMVDGNRWSILSDQQKGLIPAIDVVFPNVEHRLCARHVLTNWQRRFPGDTMKSMFWKVAHSTTKRQAIDALDEISKFSGEDAKDDLLSIDPSYWCKAFFNTHIKCDANQNNHCEAFNGVEQIIEARHKVIYSLSESIRKFVMQRLGEKKKIGLKWDRDFCPDIIKKLEEEGQFFHQWEIVFNGHEEYEVKRGLIQHAVNVFTRECSCGSWQVSGIPCCHAICCILDREEDPINYLDEWYSKDKFLKAYNYPIIPICGPNEWKKSNLIPIVPPKNARRMPGRPKTKRKLEKGEKKGNGKISLRSRKNKCSKCKEFGHNKSSCNQANQEHVSALVRKQNKRKIFGATRPVIPMGAAANETGSQYQKRTNQSVRGKKRKLTHRRSAPKGNRTEGFDGHTNSNTQPPMTTNATSWQADQSRTIPVKVGSCTVLTLGATFRQKLPTKKQQNRS